MNKNFMDINLHFVSEAVHDEHALLLLLNRNSNITSELIQSYSSLAYSFPKVKESLILYGYALKRYILCKKLNKPLGNLLLQLNDMAEEIRNLACATHGLLIDAFDFFYTIGAFPFSIDIRTCDTEDSLEKLFPIYGINNIIPPEFHNYPNELADFDMYDLLLDHTYFTHILASPEIDLYLNKHFGNKKKEQELISFIEHFYDFISPNRVNTSTTLIHKHNDPENSNRFYLHFAVTEPIDSTPHLVNLADYKSLLAHSSKLTNFLLENI